ncbi:MAG: 16S rRNA processing protein RimM, partial [Erysipelotrichaceae bacterium]|nr:16S rRNA processing protein RimM [Erysipelotrichaceae bacterium]
VMENLILGNIVGGFALDGTLKVFSMTNNAAQRYQVGNKVLLINPIDQEQKELTIVTYRPSGRFDLVKVKEILSKEEADTYRGWQLLIHKNQQDLNEGYYFFCDLVGCSIINEKNEVLGKVIKVEEFPAQITLRVSQLKKEDFFVPFIDEFILKVDIENKKIYIRQMEGMI